MSDLTNVLLDEWARIPTETLQNLPRRLEAIIAAKGGINSELMSVYLYVCMYVFRSGVSKLLSIKCANGGFDSLLTSQ